MNKGIQRKLIIAAFLLYLLAPGAATEQAQGIAAQYRQAADAYRQAAAKSKSSQNRSCYLAHAQYYDCLADQLRTGSAPRQCTQPTCSPGPEPSGTGEAGTNSAGTSPSSNGTSDPGRQMGEILDRRDRDRQVEEEMRRERDDNAKLTP